MSIVSWGVYGWVVTDKFHVTTEVTDRPIKIVKSHVPAVSKVMLTVLIT
jgi:hypothetical protein